MPIYTVFLMVVYVHFWNATDDPLDDGNKIRKPFGEARDTIYAMLTLDIVAEADDELIYMLF
jgi:hypothetical protein